MGPRRCYLVAARWYGEGPPLIAAAPRPDALVRSVDPATGATTAVHERTDATWVDIVPGCRRGPPSAGSSPWPNLDGARRLVVDDEPVTPPTLQVRAVLDVGRHRAVHAAARPGVDPACSRGGPGGAVRCTRPVARRRARRRRDRLSSWSPASTRGRRSPSPHGAERCRHDEPRRRAAACTRASRSRARAPGSCRPRCCCPSGHKPGTRLPGADGPVRRAARPARARVPQRLPDQPVVRRAGLRGRGRRRARHAGARPGVGTRGAPRPRRAGARRPGRRAARRRPREHPDLDLDRVGSAAGPSAGTSPRSRCCAGRTCSTPRSPGRPSPTGRSTTPTTRSATSATRDQTEAYAPELADRRRGRS